MSLTPKAPTRSLGLGAALATTVVVAALLTPQTATAAASLPAPDGASAATAAASCWEVKQTTPAARSGIYWLVTPELGAPQQFYCDQETDGGGWVLVGRGRDNWSDTNEGWGTPADVRSVVTGPAAFKPAQLSAKVIGGLLNGKPVSSLPDGIRLHRATNTDGTAWQDDTFTFDSPRDDWAWVFDNQQRVKTWTIGGVSGTGGQTAAFGSGTGLNRIETRTGANQGWVSGFGFGTAVHGSQAAGSYLWEASIGKGNARPFTQVFLRPKLLGADIFTAIPDSGTEKRTIPAAAESFAMPTVWGVSGLGTGPSSDNEGSNEVSAFAEGNGVVYVGGNFLTVQKSASGASAVSQPYLAAFDVKTGEWISSFRPTFDGQVKAIAVLPDGRVAAGGYFTTVNGRSQPAFVVLDPKTGATDTTFTTKVINKLASGIPVVRSLDVQGDWLYIGGTFTHMTGGTRSTEKYVRSAGRVSVTDGTPGDNWNPEFNGTVVSLDASAQGDRVYFAGYFTTSADTDAVKGAVITTDTASVIPWVIDFSSTSNYQQAVKEVGNRVWIGGSQHMLYSYARSDMSELSTNIGYPNGDIQSISTDGTVVYAGCHCFYTDYAGARRWPNIGTTWTQANKINSAGGWNNATGKYVTQFNPTVSQRGGAGAWALFNDSTGATWFGGDYKSSVKAGWTEQWSGGFVRFAHNDTDAPSRPSNLKASVGSTGTTLSWSGATDDRGSVTYEILRNDRVIATTTALSATVPVVPVDVKYFVRAADPSGNRSASTTAVPVKAGSPVDPPVDPPASNGVLIPAGSSWKYYYEATAPAAAWNTAGFDDSTWKSGAAPIGRGTADIKTALTVTSPYPLTSYYRTTATVTDATKVASVTLTARSDDGIVVYVNGKEVARNNLPSGTITSGSYATAPVSGSTAVANPVTFTVPGSAFVTGPNSITAEVHSNYRAASSHSFELSATVTAGTQPPVEDPADPGDPGDPGDPPADDTTLVANGADWQYYYADTAPGSSWNTAGFDASTWKTGAAPIGRGTNDIATTLTAASPYPLTSYYRKAVTVADATKVASVTVKARSDDGIVIYVNGTEVARNNMGTGAVDFDSYAKSSVGATTAVASPVTFEVPGSAFVTGANLITAEVHSNYHSASSHSFEMSATITPGTQPAAEDPVDPPADPPADGVLVAAGADWQYYYSDTAPGSSWNTAGFDSSTWQTGAAPIGRGTNDIATALTAASPYPLTSYYRKAISVTDAGKLGSVLVTARSDDGIVVYVNGVEVGRNNLPTGAVSADTYATAPVSASTAVANPVTFTVPASAFVTGANLITAEVHSNYHSASSHSFELIAAVQ